MSFGIVKSVNIGNKTAQVVLDNGEVSNRNYKYPKNTTAEINDRVLILNSAIIAIY